MRALGALQPTEALGFSEEVAELRFAQLPLEELARVRVDQVDATGVEPLMELAYGERFSALFAAAGRGCDEGRAKREAGNDSGKITGVHACEHINDRTARLAAQNAQQFRANATARSSAHG